MAQQLQPAIDQALGDLTNFSNADHHASVLNVFAGLPADNPQHVPAEEAMNAKARAIKLATFVAHGDIPAPGNAAFMQMLQAMEQHLTQTMNGIGDDLRQEIRRTSRSALKAINGSRSDGAFMEYEVIPFVNGNMPPGNLPALTNLAAIAALTVAQAVDYLHGYGTMNLNGLETAAKKRQKVAELIGVSADAVRIHFG
ncbi:hypothetical protein HGRIS_011527 [Hohenbuehelia grisea]|uniref:Mug135-like C-terminal domain-containing protein n=1 Tax=Hohenbuehelia grisea TaxID=104357 RepID=A0ABR3JVC4_9AGAR